MKPTRVLFVCLGNICRSPLAEGIFRHQVQAAGLADRYRIDSAGTSSYHVGEPPHPGSRQIAAERGVSLKGQRSRQVCDADFTAFDWLVAMDSDNRAALRHHADRLGLAPAKIVLLLDYAKGDGPRDVPDPYYGGGFGAVFDLIEDGSSGLLEHLEAL